MFKGKVCFISGVARGRGNGRTMALKFAEKNADVAIGDIRYEEAQGVADEIKALGRRALAVKMDVSNYEEVVGGFEQIRRELGEIDILLNNAAVMGNFVTISSMKKEAREREIGVNLTGAFLCKTGIRYNGGKKVEKGHQYFICGGNRGRFRPMQLLG